MRLPVVLSFAAATALLMAVLASPAQAQLTGIIEGVVHDPSGASVADAEVWLQHTSTGAERRLFSGPDGYFQVTGLLPGSYQARVSKQGFRVQAVRDLGLAAGSVVRFEVQLELGPQSETLVVEGQAPAISAHVADWGGRISAEKIASLPLNGRGLFALAAQEPATAVPLSYDRNLTSGMGLPIAVKGARPNQNSFQIDGVYVNDSTRTSPSSSAGVLLGLEAVGDLQVVSNPYSAEYGRTAGAAFTAVSKSGGNDFHGSLFEYFRNSSFDAKNYFDAPGEPIPSLRRNQFGGLLSGPLARNRAFFLAHYEGIRENAGRTVRPVVPNLDAREGTLPASGGGTERIAVHPAARPFLELYPAPNGRDFGDGTAEFVNESTRTTREHFLTAKADLLMPETLRLALRYSGDVGRSEQPGPMRIWSYGDDSRYDFLHSDLQAVHSPGTVSSIRFGYSQVRNLETAATGLPGRAELVFVPGQDLGSLRVSGLSDLGDSRARLRPRQYANQSYQLNADLSHLRGRHSLRFGGGFDRIGFQQFADIAIRGVFRFSSLEDLIQGVARSGELAQPGSDSHRDWRYWQFYGYAQDEWRASNRLSLSLGVRYEAASVPVERDGKTATLRDPLRDAAMTVGGPVYRNPSKKNFAPRAALAWDVAGDGKTVLRAGGGIFFDLLGSRELAIAGMWTPPLFDRLIFEQLEFPDIVAAAEQDPPPTSLDGLEYDVNQPYLARWQFTIEREIAAAHVVRLGYAAARGIHLMGQLGNINPATPEALPDGRLYFPENAPRLNPNFEQIAWRASQFNSFYQAFTASWEGRWSEPFRMQTSYTWSKSIDESSNIVFTDFLHSDLFPTMLNYRANRGLSDFDLRHVLNLNFSWRLPSPGRGLAHALAGGWELHGITLLQSGPPFAPEIGFDRARLRPGRRTIGQRPDFAVAPGTDIIRGDPRQWFDPLAFSLPAEGFYGNLGRNTIAGPGAFSLDLAVHKVLWRDEGRSLRFRAEVFNATNHPNFQVPSGRTLFNSRLRRVGSAGRITATSTPARQIQLAVRFEF